MAQIAANKVVICLIWHNTLNYNEVETSWPPEMAAMWNAFGNAIVQLRNRHGNNLPVEMYVCPITMPENAVILAQNNLPASLLPAAQIWAEYPDGTAANYFLSKNLSERFFGINWAPADVKPYIEALLYRAQPSEQSLICKILPPLCNVGGWVWLALAAGATLKAANSRNVGRATWGVGAALLWKEWYDRGGLQQLTQAAGIGKYYDDVTIRPGSRVDKYWKDLAPTPSEYGVRHYEGKHFTNVPDAIKQFNLYSIEFGNWMNQSDRLNFMYATMVTLRDMAEAVGVAQSKMGLKKTLSIAFGSRGKGGFAAAFYQPGYKVINLTKTMGRGAFTHELGHAIDHHFGKHSGWYSTRKQPDYTGKRKGSAAWLFERVLDKILWTESGKPTSYQIWLSRATPYYNRRTEIFARVCEAYFIERYKDLGIVNTWGALPGSDLPSAALVRTVYTEMKQIFQLL